jgi:SAM-dependent methyltransferase
MSTYDLAHMRANTRLDHRLAFDRVAGEYDDGRPTFGDDLVQSFADMTGLVPGDLVIEVGAGTGQLTVGLLRMGLVVTALEPGAAMRAILARRAGATGRLTISAAGFEEFTSDAHYRAVFAANSFHWLDPASSYRRAADLLAAGGHLCLLWNYPVVRSDIQRRLNEGAFRQHPDFAGDEQSMLAAIHKSAADGRQQLISSGLFDMPWWQWRTEQFEVDVERYVRLLISYANIAMLSENARKAFADDVRRELAAIPVAEVPVTNHIYGVVARATGRERLRALARLGEMADRGDFDKYLGGNSAYRK